MVKQKEMTEQLCLLQLEVSCLSKMTSQETL